MPLDELTPDRDTTGHADQVSPSGSADSSASSSPPVPSPALAPRRGAPVRLDRLYKSYADVVAVDGIDLDVAAGEFVTLLGPSGSGKTTTLMMLAGFQEVTSGEITVGDRAISRLPPNQRDIGVVFQHYALFPHMRVAENVAFPLKMRGVARSEIKRRVDAALGLVQLGTLGDRYPRQLSGGQQQRVALARAVVFEPGLALMDEPLGALDRQLREQMQFEIKQLHDSLGITVIYVTHDQEEALVMSDRIAVMNSGRIEQFAAPDELYNRPATAFVATFVGESNVLPATVVTPASTPDRSTTIVTRGGVRLTGHASDELAAGDDVVATIRPEKIVTATDADPYSDGRAGSRPNALTVTCHEVTYAGQMSRYATRTASGDVVILRVQNTPGHARFRQGDAIALSWATEDLRIFPAGQLATAPAP
ncbi:ABC transporter ATP-binding protein [Desertimonas flava]|uniref:ABC transporter ATP-binding protein n=1 Tax=Desertimonas flava TaxID=2064846 RepID=UPI000E348DC0|nr:ABC transporter ATP-binding protein [Desertimonas flava]